MTAEAYSPAAGRNGVTIDPAEAQAAVALARSVATTIAAGPTAA